MPIFKIKTNQILAGFLLLTACLAVRPEMSMAAQLFDRAIKAGFVPHKALYDISLASTRSGSQIANIHGQMLYEWDSKCDAWTSEHRFNLFYEYVDSPAMQITSDFSTYEPFDGKSMSFASRRSRDGQLFEELRGQAVLGKDGSGEAVYTMPEDLLFDLPAGTVFPMEHSLQVLKHIQNNEKFYNAVIFDGSDQDGPVEVNSFIGSGLHKVDMPERKSIDTAMLKVPAHKVRLAFFPLEDDSATSDYEMTIILHNNGVISDMLIEYHDFSVTQTLVALEEKEEGCKKETAR